MKRKKFMALLLAAGILGSLAACGNKENAPAENAETQNAAEKVQILLDKIAFQSGYLQATQPECVELLRAGKLAMYPTCSWQVSVFEKY